MAGTNTLEQNTKILRKFGSTKTYVEVFSPPKSSWWHENLYKVI